MASLAGQPAEGIPKKLLIQIGSAFGAFALTLTILNYMPAFSGNNPSGQQIPYGTLAFWIAWILVFALLDRYLVPKPATITVPPELQQKKRLLLTGALILGVIDLVIMARVMQKWTFGSEEGIIPLMILWCVLALVASVLATLYFIAVMDARDKNRNQAEAGRALPLQPESEQDRNAR